ncbi:hypothetical protein KJY78_01085 [Canibacter sp. lx-45]|uniref:PH-like domain-containing protein n=1 Tax=Canibacter zhuwentaonis TaxID=2837491 RepID=UPI001BDC5A37|nr:hypothetical protein [Canibacter zhuwentaonis]MBT1034949.1 hypothetical protein [Canibacter zhuwentaonis]
MSYAINALVCLAIIGLSFFGMWRGWRKRASAGELLPTQIEPAGAALRHFERVLYVVTNSAVSKYQRVSLPGLKYRGYAAVTVHENAVRVAVTGESECVLQRITGVSLGRNSIAKAVEAGGLVIISWQVAERELETVFRFASDTEQTEFIALVKTIIENKGAVRC